MVYSCQIFECTLTDSPSISKSEEMKLISISNSDKTSTLGFEDISFLIKLPPITETQETNQSITTLITSFVKINVIDEISTENCPIFYYDSSDDSKQLINCIVDSHIAFCNVPNTIENTQDSSTYTIFYNDPITNSKTSTGVTISVNIKTISIVNVTFQDSSTITSTRDISASIILTANEDFSGDIYSAIIQNVDASKTIAYTKCTISVSNAKEMECNTPSDAVDGEFHLLEIKAEVIYDISSISSISLIADTIWYPQKYKYYSESTIPTFEFQLRDSTQEVSIFEDETDCNNSQNQVSCNKDSNDSTLLVCEASNLSYIVPVIGIIVNNQKLCAESVIQ